MTSDHGPGQVAPSAGTAVLDQAFDRNSLYALRAARNLTRPDMAAWGREHGHGLWMIDQLADKVTLDRSADGTTVTMTFIISSPG